MRFGIIEYPMEARIVVWDGVRMMSRLLAIDPPAAAESLHDAPWTGGRKEDREWTLDENKET